MNVQQLAEHLDKLMQQGHSQEEVFLDTDPVNLFAIDEVEYVPDMEGVIIWGSRDVEGEG